MDAVACVEAAIAQAERLLAAADGSRDVQEGGSRDQGRDWRLRADRGHVEVVDETSGEVTTRVVPITLVTDNGPAFRSATFAQLFTGPTAGVDPLLRHVRTRVRSPQTNGVVERFFGTLKYEHLYRTRLPDGDALAVECNLFRQTYNTRRPHQSLGNRTPRAAHLAAAEVSDVSISLGD